MYDFANTAFSALFVTFFFPFYIKHFLGGNEFQIGLVLGISMFLVGVIVPIIGTLADLTGKRVRMIGAFTVICVGFTVLVAFSDLYLALLSGLVANFFYHACLVVYNSLLPSVSGKKEIGKVSGIGVGVGYLGTLFSLIMAFFILNWLGWETKIGVSAIFLATAAFFLVFSIPLFVSIKDPKERKKVPFPKHLKNAFAELKHTLLRITKYKGLVPFLISSFAYSNGLTAIIIFLYLFAREEIKLGVLAFMGVYVVFSLAAGIGSYASGIMSDKIGPKKTLVIAGIVWVVLVALLIGFKTLEAFVVAGIFGGAALGAVWTASRPMLIALAPKIKVGQFFGLDELTDKFSGVLGPIIFGFLVVAVNYNFAMVSVGLFFVIGLIALSKVPDLRK
jgi:UMF1 family MFS transporter